MNNSVWQEQATVCVGRSSLVRGWCFGGVSGKAVVEVLNYVTNFKGLSNSTNSDEISMNPFSDLLNSEFSQMMNGAIPSEPKELVKGMTRL